MTTTFDGWEARLTGDAMALPDGQLSDNTLMHFRTKGSRNGVRRYQLEDGTWTPLGLRERKEREGWGDGVRSRAQAKAEKRAYKAEKRNAKITKKLAKKEAKKERKAARAEKKRLGNIKRLTDDELQKKIARVKMEQEYKELTRSNVLKSGEKFVSRIMEHKAKKAQREEDKAKRELDLMKAKTELLRVKTSVAKAKEDRLAAMAKAQEHASDAEKAKMEYKKGKDERKEGHSLWRGIRKSMVIGMTAGKKEKLTAIRKAEGDVKGKNAAERILEDERLRNQKIQMGRIEEYKKQQAKRDKESAKRIRDYTRQTMKNDARRREAAKRSADNAERIRKAAAERDRRMQERLQRSLEEARRRKRAEDKRTREVNQRQKNWGYLVGRT